MLFFRYRKTFFSTSRLNFYYKTKTFTLAICFLYLSLELFNKNLLTLH